MEAQIPSVNFLCYLPLRFPYTILLRYFPVFFHCFSSIGCLWRFPTACGTGPLQKVDLIPDFLWILYPYHGIEHLWCRNHWKVYIVGGKPLCGTVLFLCPG